MIKMFVGGNIILTNEENAKRKVTQTVDAIQQKVEVSQTLDPQKKEVVNAILEEVEILALQDRRS